MSRFIDEADRSQGTLLPETIDEYVCEENPVRVIDAFVGALDLASLGFEGVEPEATGRPAYHPATIGGLSSGAVRPPDLPGEASRRRARAQHMAGSTNRLGTDRWFEFPIRPYYDELWSFLRARITGDLARGPVTRLPEDEAQR